MARNKNHYSNEQDERGFSTPTANLSRLLRPTVPLSEVQDFRLYNPTPDFDVSRTVSGRRARVVLKDRHFVDRFGNQIRSQSQTKAIRAFHAPDRVVTCLRRKERREILFASGKGGKPTRSFRPRRLNHQSKISCK